MEKTTYLGLQYTSDSSTLFKDWWRLLETNWKILDNSLSNITVLNGLSESSDGSLLYKNTTIGKVYKAGDGIYISDDGTISISYSDGESLSY